LKKKGLDAWSEKSDRVGDYIGKEGRKMYNGMPVWYPATKAIKDKNIELGTIHWWKIDILKFN
jgi:hypothetical protein